MTAKVKKKADSSAKDGKSKGIDEALAQIEK